MTTSNLKVLGLFDEFIKNAVSEVCVDNETVLVFSDGTELYACSALCPHRGAPMAESLRITNRLLCRWHGSEFDLKTGEPYTGPATLPLRVWKLQIIADLVYIEWS